MIWILLVSLLIVAAYSALMLTFNHGISVSRAKCYYNPNLPHVSIVVALHNEFDNVGRLVSDIENQDYPSDLLDVVLVDDHSTDGTWEELQLAAKGKIRVIRSEGVGKKKAIETGVKYADGIWVAVTDADCNVPNTWLMGLTAPITESVKMVLGPVFIPYGKGLLQQLQQVEFLGLQGATAGSAGLGYPVSANGANMLFHRQTFLDLKPYASNYFLPTGDDQFLLMSVSSVYPRSVVYAMNPYALLYTQPVDTWDAFLKQRARWASKGSAYRSQFPLVVGILVFVMALLILLYSAYGLLFIGPIALIPLGVKLLADLFVVVPMARYSNTSINPFVYLISGIVYPFVIVYSVLAGMNQPKIPITQPRK